MLSKLVSLFSSLLVGGSMFFGFAQPNALPAVRRSGERPALQAIVTPGAPGTAVSQEPDPMRSLPSRILQGDRNLRRGLVLATVQASGLPPREVVQALKDGKTVVEIAESAGKTENDVLLAFDREVETLFTRAVENGRLPDGLAQSRIDWYQAAARQMTHQPGLTPSYPGLHTMHLVAIAASVKVGGLDRGEVLTQLEACQTLDEILQKSGHTGQEAVDFATARIDALLDKAVENGKLSPELRASWHTGLQNTLEKMMSTPGLHVAGKMCSK